MANRSPDGTTGVRSASKVIGLLDLFSEARPRLTVDQISGLTGLPPSTAYRYVALLRDLGLLEEGENGFYHLGLKVVAWARVALSATSVPDLAWPHMKALADATGELVMLARRFGDDAVCISRVDSPRRVRVSYEIGQHLPLHAGATAKALLSLLPDGELDRYLAARPAAERDGIRRDVEVIRENGFAETLGEVDPGIWAVAVPIVVAPGQEWDLTVAVPDYLLTEERRTEIRECIVDAGRAIEARVDEARLSH